MKFSFGSELAIQRQEHKRFALFHKVTEGRYKARIALEA